MTVYTSGTQAIQGRTVNHDKNPWRNIHDDTRWPDNWSNWDGLVYDPRPEFDVLDNPILASFRANDQHPEASDWARDLEYPALSSWHYVDRSQIEHARRVLAKLATLTKEA